MLAPTIPRLTPQLRILQLQNVIEGMKEQMVRLENYCQKRRRRGLALAPQSSSLRRSNGDDEPSEDADGNEDEELESDDGEQELEETHPPNIMTLH